MKILDDGTLVSFIHKGDYIVFRSTSKGIEVDYSPDAEVGSPIIGAFATNKGKFIHLKELEANEHLRGLGADGMLEHLARCLKKGRLTGKEDMEAAALARLVQVFAQNRSREVFEGTTQDFYNDCISVITTRSYDPATRRLINQLGSFLPGFIYTGKGRYRRLKVIWNDIPEPENNKI